MNKESDGVYIYVAMFSSSFLFCSTISIHYFTSYTMAYLAFLAFAAGALAGSPDSCPGTVQSCQNTTAMNTCCFNAPGGLLLQTQFWDADPATGPSDSWTIHGLWPDHCDGSFSSSCDSSRAYTGINTILEDFGMDDVLDYMNTYWKNQGASDESLWEHEWAKHGTCISTLNPSCYNDYESKEEAADFFNRTVSLFQSLPTYDVSTLVATQTES